MVLLAYILFVHTKRWTESSLAESDVAAIIMTMEKRSMSSSYENQQHRCWESLLRDLHALHLKGRRMHMGPSR